MKSPLTKGDKGGCNNPLAPFNKGELGDTSLG
jgi:hypothetical protein